MLMHQHCYLSTDYSRELEMVKDKTFFEQLDRVFQLNFNLDAVAEKSEEEKLRIANARKEQGRRLREQLSKKRDEKLREQESELINLRELKKIKMTEPEDFLEQLESHGFQSEEQLDSMINNLDNKIRTLKNKIMGVEEVEEPKEKPSFPLVDVPDEDLTPEERKEKRKQKMLKANMEAREKVRANKELQKSKEEEEARLDEKRRVETPELWLAELRGKREQIMEKIKERNKIKSQLADRRSVASQIRMKNITALADDGEGGSGANNANGGPGQKPRKRRKKKNEEDIFGADDADWLVYKEISREDSEGEEEDLEKLSKIEEKLSKYDPNFQPNEEEKNAFSLVRMLTQGVNFNNTPAEQFQIHLNVERFRVPEIIYQPSILGIDQGGITSAVRSLLDGFNYQLQNSFAKNIFVTGGTTLFPNFEPRLSLELRQIFPFGADVQVKKAKDPLLDSWRGGARWSITNEFQEKAITYQQYQECGHDYFIEHPFSNPFYRIPGGMETDN